MKKVIKIFTIFAILILGSSVNNFAQNEIESDGYLLPKAFDLWANQKLEEEKNEKKVDLNSINSRIIKRFKAGIFTSSDGVFEVIKINSIRDTKSRKDGFYFTYDNALNLIEELLETIYKRDDLKLRLLEEKAFLLENTPGKSDEYKQQVFSTNELYIDLAKENTLWSLIKVNKANLKIGNILLGENKKDEAKARFLEIMKYPFYSITDPGSFKEMRKLYIDSATGLINASRGDFSALKKLNFVPSTTSELYPLLKLYYEELSVEWDRNIESNMKFRGN